MTTRQTFAAALAALALQACGPAAPKPPSLSAGDAAVTFATDGRSATWRLDDKRLLDLPVDAFRVGVVPEISPDRSYDPYWLEADDPLATVPGDLEWRDPTGSTITVEGANTARIELTYEGGAATVVVRVAGPGRLECSFAPRFTAEKVAYVRLRLRGSKDEGFYGLGGWGDGVNHRGKWRPMQLEADLASEGASTENHVPVPFLVGTSGWGLFVQSRQPGVFGVAKGEKDLVEAVYSLAREPAGKLDFHLFADAVPLDLMRHYYRLTGNPRLPSPWALGPWLWRDENKDQAEVLDDARKLRELDLATSGVWIDRPYASAVNSFDFKPTQFPEPVLMVKALHAAGLRVALWHTPYVEKAAGALAVEAEEKGYFPPQTGPLLNGWSKPVDLTNAKAYDWWQGLVRRYTALGIEGFKLDYAEDVMVGIGGAPARWRFADGSTEATMHHDYQLLYHRIYSETLGSDGGFLLCRTGRWGGQAHASVIWPGDLDADMSQKDELRSDGRKGVGGLPASVAIDVGLSASGFPFYGADTGGYRHSPPDEETFVRWFQQTALSTVMQVGDSSSQPPWVYTSANGRDDDTVALYRTFARLHLRLFPYEWTYAQAIARTGRPITRAVGLAYPGLGEHPSDEYLFGEDLLVAPVVVKGAVTKSVLFPPGTWADWFDGSVHAGGVREEVRAPLEKLPLYLREGAIVPMLRPTIDTLSPATDAGVDSFANDAGLLWVRVYPGAGETTFTLYDGTRVTQQRKDGIVTVSLAPGAVFTKGAMLEVIRTESVEAQLDQTPLVTPPPGSPLETRESGYARSLEMGGTAWVKLPPAGGTVRIR
jgi:alpha-D-xyloside xylohydrolase